MTEAERITRALLGTWHRGYGVARCPAHDDRNPSLSLGDGADGRLLLSCKAGCPFEAVIDALRVLGLVEGRGRGFTADAAETARHEAERRREAERKERQARSLWHEALPITGTPAEAYLRGRGITCDLPATLRFHPAAWHGATARTLPAMVAAVTDAPGPAVHRTYLRPDGSDKADVDPAKAMLGATMGGAVRLVRAHGPLVVAEGVETALSLACGLLDGPATIWAALSASGMAGLVLPEAAGKLIVATDGDKAGREAGHKLAERATALGWEVSLLPAPDGRDWNDVLRQKEGAA